MWEFPHPIVSVNSVVRSPSMRSGSYAVERFTNARLKRFGEGRIPLCVPKKCLEEFVIDFRVDDEVSHDIPPLYARVQSSVPK